MEDRGKPAARRMRAGNKLRAMRQRAGITMGEAAAVLPSASSKISRIEQGQAPLQTHEITQLLEVYGLAADDPERLAVLEDVRATQALPWWHEFRDVVAPGEKPYLSLEADAAEIRVWARDVIPDLLQTSAYAAALEPANRRYDKSALRRRALLDARQALLQATDRRLWVILHESVLLQQVGDPDIMREQAAALVRSAKEPGITIQVARMSAGALRGTGTPFTMLRFDDREVPDVAWAWTPANAVCTSRMRELERYRAAWAICSIAAEEPAATPGIIENIIKGIW